MVNPFISAQDGRSLRLSVPHVSALVEWVHAHAETPIPPKAVIAESVLAFIKKVDKLLDKELPVVCDYDIPKLARELSKYSA